MEQHLITAAAEAAHVQWMQGSHKGTRQGWTVEDTRIIFRSFPARRQQWEDIVRAVIPIVEVI